MSGTTSRPPGLPRFRRLPVSSLVVFRAPGVVLTADDSPAGRAVGLELLSGPLVVGRSQHHFQKNAAIDIASCHNTDKAGTAQGFASQATAILPGKEIWTTELHGWKSTSGADEALSSAYMFECIRAGFSGLSGWLAIGTTAQGHSYILNSGGTVTRNVKYFIFRKLSTTSHSGNALDINQPAEFDADPASDEADAGTSTCRSDPWVIS